MNKWFKKLTEFFDKGTYIRELNDSRYYTQKQFIIIKKHLIGQSTLCKIIEAKAGEFPAYDTLMINDIQKAYEEASDKIDLMSLLSIQPTRKYYWTSRLSFNDYKLKDTKYEDVLTEYAEYFI